MLGPHTRMMVRAEELARIIHPEIYAAQRGLSFSRAGRGDVWRRGRGGLGFCGVAGGVLLQGARPGRLRRQLDEADGEAGEALLVGEGRRQGDLDSGRHLGDPGGDLDQPEAQRVELRVTPERSEEHTSEL